MSILTDSPTSEIEQENSKDAKVQLQAIYRSIARSEYYENKNNFKRSTLLRNVNDPKSFRQFKNNIEKLVADDTFQIKDPEKQVVIDHKQIKKFHLENGRRKAHYETIAILKVVDKPAINSDNYTEMKQYRARTQLQLKKYYEGYNTLENGERIHVKGFKDRLKDVEAIQDPKKRTKELNSLLKESREMLANSFDEVSRTELVTENHEFISKKVSKVNVDYAIKSIRHLQDVSKYSVSDLINEYTESLKADKLNINSATSRELQDLFEDSLINPTMVIQTNRSVSDREYNQHIKAAMEKGEYDLSKDFYTYKDENNTTIKINKSTVQTFKTIDAVDPKSNIIDFSSNDEKLIIDAKTKPYETISKFYKLGQNHHIETNYKDIYDLSKDHFNRTNEVLLQRADSVEMNFKEANDYLFERLEAGEIDFKQYGVLKEEAWEAAQRGSKAKAILEQTSAKVTMENKAIKYLNDVPEVKPEVKPEEKVQEKVQDNLKDSIEKKPLKVDIDKDGIDDKKDVNKNHTDNSNIDNVKEVKKVDLSKLDEAKKIKKQNEETIKELNGVGARVKAIVKLYDELPEAEVKRIEEIIDKNYSKNGKPDSDTEYFLNENKKLSGIRIKDEDFGTTDKKSLEQDQDLRDRSLERDKEVTKFNKNKHK
jgi:hypothetical protein